MTLALHYALRSDVGLLREGNEDSAYAGPRLLAIADGMGGHAAGEVASAVAISALVPLDAEAPSDGGEMLGALAAAVASARRTLHEMSEADPTTEGMGTTLTALLWAVPQVAICHIGDSRAYLLRDGDLYQITRDHTLIQSLVDEGRLSPAAALNHPQRSLIMRALQGSTEVDPDLTMHEALLGDRYLLCSDGLTDVVSDEAVHETLVTIEDADQAVRLLIDQANHNGGPDNITCIVADVVDTDGPVPPTTARVFAGAADPDPKSLLATQSGAEAPAKGSAPQASPNGYHARGDDEDDDPDADDGPRRRWPVVTSVLAVLILLIVGGLFVGWRFTQGQYYVDADGSHVVIYRGISDQIGGLHLSSVYKRTAIPVEAVPADLQLPTAPGTLATAQHTVNTLQRAYTTTCQQAKSAQAAWVAKYKTPAPTKTTKSKGKKTTPPTPPPEPTVPGYCSAMEAG